MRKHPFDITAFVWGTMFLGAAALFALDEYGQVTLNARWLLPVALIGLGIVGIGNALRAMRK